MSTKKSFEHVVFGFYGLRKSNVIEQIYHRALDWFEMLDCVPHVMGTNLDKGRLITFNRSASRIKKSGFSELSDFQIASLPTGAKNILEGDDLQIVFSTADNCLAISGRKAIIDFIDEAALIISREAIETCSPEYGIGLYRNERLGPTLYVIGVICQASLSGFRVSDEECDRIDGWSRFGMKNKTWKFGLIRDIYPWNFLTALQWNKKVGDQTLKEWIESNATRGTLKPVSEDMFLWMVPSDQIYAIRETLQTSGIVLDPNRADRIWYSLRDCDYTSEQFMELLMDPHFEPPAELKNGMQLTSQQVLAQVLGNEDSKYFRVIHVDNSGTKSRTRDLNSEEIDKLRYDD